MHESGLARAVVEALRAGPSWSRARVLLADPSFGHRPEALRFHMEAQAPDLDLSRVDIVPVPVPAVCARCAREIHVAGADDACPACGGPVLATGSSPIVHVETFGESHP